MTLSIITVGMNHLSYLEVLLESLYNKNKPKYDFEMVYVDNCSTDGTVDYIRKHYPQVNIVQNVEPLGFGENNNKGVMASTGDVIAIINPDIVLQENSLDSIIEQLNNNEGNVIYAPQLLNPDGSVQYSVRSFITLRMFVKRLLSKGDDNSVSDEMIKYLCKDIDTNKIQAVDWAMGAALLMNRDTYAKLGGFDQRYFLYMEDEDLCLRAWKMNIPVIYYPYSKMIHNHLRGSSKLGKKTFLHFQSLYTFFKRHGFSVKSQKVNYNL
ncbi:MAG: glycosyltransferase family 2 protein [Bacteroidaceae bacterium]|nr:glycosyltransferase family 2 protein [Bacteroidaceae bacterium]